MPDRYIAVKAYINRILTERHLAGHRQVAKEGKKCVVQVLIQTASVCIYGEHLNAAVGFPVTLDGKSKAAETGKDVFTGGTATWTVNGSFSSEKALSGSAKKVSSAGPLRPEVGTCSTGDVKFSLHFKG